MAPFQQAPQVNQEPPKTYSRLLQEWMFPNGIIKPQMLAATTTIAKGDLYYVDSNGLFQRLPIGTENQVLTVKSGIPKWV